LFTRYGKLLKLLLNQAQRQHFCHVCLSELDVDISVGKLLQRGSVKINTEPCFPLLLFHKRVASAVLTKESDNRFFAAVLKFGWL
jgi:predicted nucleotide-binding protein (sugar kinase/HSP70/actin superfamily)